MSVVDRTLAAIFGPKKRDPKQRTPDIAPAPHSLRDRQPVDQQRVASIKKNAAKKGY